MRSVSIDDTTLVGGTLDDDLAKGVDVPVTQISDNTTAITYQVIVTSLTQLVVSVVMNSTSM